MNFEEHWSEDQSYRPSITDKSELDETWKSLLYMRILIQKKIGNHAFTEPSPLIEVVVEEVTEEEDYVKFKDVASEKFFWEQVKTVRETTNFRRIKTLGLLSFLNRATKNKSEEDKRAKGF
jgi:hypothetical protein